MNVKARTQHPIEIRSPSAINDPVGAAVELLALSPLHRNWTIRDLKRLLVPPMEQEQCVFGVQSGYPVAFVTWALLSPDAYEGLVRRSRILRADDWTSGDELWVIDLVAPNELTVGSPVPKLVRLLRAHLSARYPEIQRATAVRQRQKTRRIARYTRL